MNDATGNMSVSRTWYQVQYPVVAIHKENRPVINGDRASFEGCKNRVRALGKLSLEDAAKESMAKGRSCPKLAAKSSYFKSTACCPAFN